MEQGETAVVSWNGFNVSGDRRSAEEVQRLIHVGAQIEEWRTAFDERTQATAAERDALRNALAGLRYRDEPGEPARFCDHAVEPCSRCEAARAALKEPA